LALLQEIALRGTWLDREDVSRLFRQTAPGMDEIAALLEIAKLAASSSYDAIVVDTAPTGHTLRLLALPETMHAVARVFDRMQEKHRAMVAALRGAWSADAADLLIDEIAADADGVRALLRDTTRVRVTWVTLAEPLALEETRDALAQLGREGIGVHDLVVNRLTPARAQPCAWCAARRGFEQRTLAAIVLAFGGVKMSGVTARQPEPRSVKALTALAAELRRPLPPVAHHHARIGRPIRALCPTAGEPADPIGQSDTLLVLFGGKGGAGKTTCAAATALDFAVRFPRRRVLLISTDPAHSLADVLAERVSDTPRRLERGPRNLVVRELDATKQFAVMRQQYGHAIDDMVARFSRTGPIDTSHDRRVLRDLLELAPPGIDELAGVVEVTNAVLDPRASYGVVVMDTAPTGHALRLLETPAVVQAWAKAVMAILLKYQSLVGAGDLGRLLLSLSQGLGRLRQLLSDPRRSRFIAVTRAEILSTAQTGRLLQRLGGLGIATPMIVVNVLGAGSCRAAASARRRGRRRGSSLARSDTRRPSCTPQRKCPRPSVVRL
jgi:arsenite-transporting ATPase